MKKRIAFLLAVVMLLSMAACAAKETPQNNTPAETPAAPAPEKNPRPRKPKAPETAEKKPRPRKPRTEQPKA